MRSVSFVHMEDGTKEDYEFIARFDREQGRSLAERVLAELRRGGDVPGPWKITRYQHALQTATRALRDGADEETVVAALVHDVGDHLAPANHSEFAASILRPYVSEATWWVVEHHGIFQAYYYDHHYGGDRHARERYRGHPHFDRTAAFCHDWDQKSFDPDYETLPIEAFEPLVRRVFARRPRHELRSA
jgi:predicted HD phosphohydrolase